MPSFGSTPGGASILITSAPKSARMRQHVGPARTRVRSSTRRWDSAGEATGFVMGWFPVSAPGRQSRSGDGRASRWSICIRRTRSSSARSVPRASDDLQADRHPALVEPGRDGNGGQAQQIDEAGEAAQRVERPRRKAIRARVALGGARRQDRHDGQHRDIMAGQYLLLECPNQTRPRVRCSRPAWHPKSPVPWPAGAAAKGRRWHCRAMTDACGRFRPA